MTHSVRHMFGLTIRTSLLARLDDEWAPAEGASCPIVIDRDRHHCFDSAGQRVD